MSNKALAIAPNGAPGLSSLRDRAPSGLAADAHQSPIARSRYWHALDKFSVVLTDGRLGIGDTFEEALANAQAIDAENVLRAA